MGEGGVGDEWARVVGELNLVGEGDGVVRELYFEGLADEIVAALGWIID
jgi:hypothetical protein